MNRRSFLNTAVALGLRTSNAVAPPPAFQSEKSKLKVAGIRLVKTTPRRPPPEYKPAAGSWSTGGVEVANPMSIYPEYKPMRSLFMADDPSIGGFTVEIATDKGVKGYGRGGPGGGAIVEKHLTKLLLGKDPFDLERNWDILWRSTMYYGRAGAVVHAISGADLALWDVVGNALGMPVYRLLGGETKARIPAYCTGNDIEQHIEYGFKRLKLAIPYGPADGKEGMRKNVELVRRTRELLGTDGDIMLDCWMAWTERQPHDYEGFGRLNAAIKSTRIVTGEHEYTRYGFRHLLEHNAASIWQPDVNWCGGLTELRRIGALAAAYDIPVIPHGGGLGEGVHYIMATTNAPWAEMFMPAPGGPKEVYQLWEESYNLSKGPEGVYMRPSERPGFGWDFVVS